ncbi:hypothetical protein BV22DRAFT_1134217 [Leucogyrophana mollusca]|uniref:Uncharacterized protein n=1 Tax=Leucogyrophana mollusca TaxID=85980 RepID=A0ACB8B142_9AGAM|nr:hypothetical protein BV22DRAFT_1134217 [Leucogyrophana mollusca]
MSWTPDETPVELIDELLWLQGDLVAAIVYGIILALFAMCFPPLWVSVRNRATKSMASMLLFLYVSVTFILGTTVFATNSRFIQLAFIENRDFPGGPNAYAEEMFSVPVNIVSNVAFVLANWCTDSLMLWRCAVVYSDSGILARLAAVGGAGLVFLTSAALSILWLFQVSSPLSSPTRNTAMGVNYTAPFFGVALAVNLVITVMIALRLLYQRRRFARLYGPSAQGLPYTSIVAMTVESASLYSVFSLLFIIPFAVNSSLQNATLQFLGEIEIVASLLIIYRVLQGRAWSNETATEVASITWSNDACTRGLEIPNASRGNAIDRHSKATTVRVVVDNRKLGSNV